MTGKEYVLSVLEQVEKRNNNEKEFLDAVKEVALSLAPVFDKHPEYISEGLLERIVEPERQIMFRVPWIDDEGKKVTAIVDAKSKSSGQVSHNDVSDVAIDAHKEKNNADYVAIVGAGFSGDTIKNFASRKKVALITDQELIDIAKKAEELGFNLQEIAIIFQSPDGKSRLQELISTKQREQNLIELIVATFRKEQEMLESISARDMFLLLRMTDNSPSLEEILNVFSLLSTDEIDVLEMNKQASAKENTTYTMKNAKATVNRLKMIANAIEKGIEK